MLNSRREPSIIFRTQKNALRQTHVRKQECIEMLKLTLFLLFLTRVAAAIRCYECSAFPRERYSQDERLSRCPGARSAATDRAPGLYDACMAITLSNGTVVAQNAVGYGTCQGYRTALPPTVEETFGMAGTVWCCRKDFCNGSEKGKRKRKRKKKPKKIMMIRMPSSSTNGDRDNDNSNDNLTRVSDCVCSFSSSTPRSSLSLLFLLLATLIMSFTAFAV